MGLKEKVALVTGAGNGMGRETVKMMLEKGFIVVGTDVFEDDLEDLQKECSDVKGKLIAYPGDLRKSEFIQELIGFVNEKFGKIDILACVAGVVDDMSPIYATDDEVWENTININLTSVFKIIREAYPLLQDHEETANIIIVSSIGGINGTSSGVSYISSKHAIQGLMKNVAFSSMNHNIRCNNVAPGSIATGIIANAERLFPDREVVSEESDVFNKRGVLTQLIELGTPEDIGRAVMFLVSEEAKYINGTTLVVDGGWTCL